MQAMGRYHVDQRAGAAGRGAGVLLITDASEVAEPVVLGAGRCVAAGELFDAVSVVSSRPTNMKTPNITASATAPPAIQPNQLPSSRRPFRRLGSFLYVMCCSSYLPSWQRRVLDAVPSTHQGLAVASFDALLHPVGGDVDGSFPSDHDGGFRTSIRTPTREEAMTDFTNSELDMMSRALERAMSSLRAEPRRTYTTADLAAGIFAAASEGVRCEHALAKRAVEHARASFEEAHKIIESAAA
jgi:hypothetical protein